MGLYRIFLLCGFISLLAPSVFAQRTQDLVAPDAEFRKGLDLFEKQKFAEAQEIFDGIVSTADSPHDLFVTDAEYYAAICAMELFSKDAEVRLTAFLEHHPESPRCRMVHFQLGRYNYRKKDYDEALAWFRQVQIYDLNEEELSEFYFKRGYSHYSLGHVDSAKKDFFEIRDISSKYSPSANYYYSHIAYTEGNYETALQGFLKLQEDPVFGPVTPWYISQIYYLQGNYNMVISYAPPLLDSSDTKKVPEIAHIIGASYYRTSRYREAIPFLKKHADGVNRLTRQEAYELGFAYYKSDSVAQAVEYFAEAAADSADALAQNAWYHLADCHLRNGDKQSARMAYGKAASMKFDPMIREDALFSHARLSYELSFSPFNEAIVALNNYLIEYPNNPRSDEAYLLLTDVYLSSKNYALALASIEKIKVLTPAMQGTYQKVAYNRGIELYNQRDYTGAIMHFDKSLTYPISRELNSQAQYWKGESWYAYAEARDSTAYNKAIDCYKKFQVTPGAPVLANYNTANYNIGYCYMGQKKYGEAVVWFRKYVTNKGPNDNNDRVFDAYLCMGDGYFRMGDFINASEFYGKAVATQTTSPFNKDYALYQQAMAYGYLGKKQEKADALKKMREEYPGSMHLANGRYQEARTLHELKEYDRALSLYNEVYMQDKTGVFAISCLTNMASIYSIKKDYDNALAMYKDAANLLKPKGTGVEYQSVMSEIKEMYLAKNQLEQWENYAGSMGYVESQVVADSTAYAQAAKMYNAGNCAEALTQANKYILRYPSGLYITEVHYMRAECSWKNGDTTNALGSYNAVLNKGQTKYTDMCLKRSGYIYYTRKDWPNASRVYSRLANEGKNEVDRNDAKVNAMRTYLFAKNIDSANVYATMVLGLSGISNAVKGEANYIRGKSAMNGGDNAAAKTYFSKVAGLAPNTVYAAEASYQMCRIDYLAKPSKGVQAAILKHINDYDGYAEWSGEGWLLLADNYLALKDTAGAKFVLEGYIENGDSPSHVQRAKDKLTLIGSMQGGQGERRQEELILPMGDPDDQKLFENGQGNGEGGQP